MAFSIVPSFFIIPSNVHPTNNFEKFDVQEPSLKSSQFMPRTIRVAIYNEPNMTDPYYVTGGGIVSNNYTALKSLLIGAGYQVDELTCNDIFNHKLKTADYDVFIMVDNNPRENITNNVKEFWLGGGGIMSFDGAINYICYAGMLPPDSEGSDGYGIYWGYPTFENISEITTRHPVTKTYQIGDTFGEDEYLNWAAFDWAQLMTTSIASDLVKLATNFGLSNEATVVAHNPSARGGRVLQMFGDGNIIDGNRSDIIIDAIDWLCPRPKGRIVFDLSHFPYYGVDQWDQDGGYANYGERYNIWRNYLVNHSYTFDKLYPSKSGNLTSSNLAPYDMVILCTPNENYTASEVSSVINWVKNGGGLFVIGGRYNVVLDPDKNINYLLSLTDLKINLTDSGSNIIDYQVEHPTVEGCTELDSNFSPGLINYSGNAFPIWGNSNNTIVIGGQEYGNGRIILSGDIYFLRMDTIGLQDNLQFGINLANWLTASQAKILLFVNEPYSPNYYRTPVVQALNDLNVPFFLTFDYIYLNLSLYKYNWELVIVDQPWYPMDLDIFIDYVDSGGRIIMSTFMVDDNPSHPLWAKLGFSFAANELTPVPIYLWSPSHRIFTTPANYGAANFTSFIDYGDVGDLLTIYPNATALAGFTNTTQTGNATIVLRKDGKTLFNAYLIDQFSGDVDDSTYEDRLELWINEIAYMMYRSLGISINTPLDYQIFGANITDYSINVAGIYRNKMWHTFNDSSKYYVTSTSGELSQAGWDALSDGNVSLKFYVNNLIGYQKYDEVIIVKDTTPPTIKITSPITEEKFFKTPPEFIFEIRDPHLDKMWYTINNGTAKYFFTTNGSISTPAWEVLTKGDIIINVFANDTVGNEASKSVSIIKSKKMPPGIPGYSSYLIIGVISIISLIILEKQLKRIKFKK